MVRPVVLLAICMVAASQAWSMSREKRFVDLIPKTAEACKDIPVEIGIVLDSSSSIWRPDFDIAKEFLQDMVSFFDIGPTQTRVSLILFGNGIYTDQAFDLATYSTKDALLEAFGNVKHKFGGYTSTGKGIDYMRENQLTSEKTRPGVTRIGVVITDGNSQETAATAEAAKKAVADGIIMIAVGVGRGVNAQELKNIAGGNSSNVHTAAKFSELAKVLEPLQEQICVPLAIPTTPVPQNPACNISPVDIYFVFSQRSLGLEMTAWTVDFITKLVGSDEFSGAFRYGVISDLCDEGFDIGAYRELAGLTERVQGYTTYTLPSLVNKLVAKGFPVDCSQKRTQVAIVFANSDKGAKELEGHVAALVDQGVKVFVVDVAGVGLSIDGAVTVAGDESTISSHALLQLLCA